MNNKSQLLHVSPVGQTDVGLVRKNNEDSFLIADLTGGAERINDLPLNHVVGERGSLFMVADGMGGAQASPHPDSRTGQASRRENHAT